MRFVLNTVRNGCRLGCITEIGADTCKDLSTPLCMLYTRAGSAPHLTRDLLDKIGDMPGVAQMPLTLLAENTEILKQFGHGIGSFAGMKDYLIYCCLQDSAELVPSGYNSNAGVSVWGRGGKITLNVTDYMKTIEAVQPHWYQALCDSDTPQSTSRKRLRKSVDRTLQYTDQCIEQQAGLAKLQKAGIIGVIEGGFSKEERLRSARETAKKPVAGFCIEGFHSFGPETEQFSLSTVKELIEAVLAEIPLDKPRLLPGLWNPLDIIQAVRMGIDFFDSTYPYVITSRGSAMVFDFSSPSLEIPEPEGSYLEISLKDDRFSGDLRPVMEQCRCYTCTTHTRAYIHHLLDTSELLANVLLMTHNFHHYFGFFRAIREAVANDTLDSIERQLTKYRCLPYSGGAEPKAAVKDRIVIDD